MNKLQSLLKIFNEKRKSEGLTQQKFAKALKISQSAVPQYFTGAIPLNTDFILKAAKVLNIPATTLDPTLQQITILDKRRRLVQIVNEQLVIEAFTDATALGYKIPNNDFAPRYIAEDTVIFTEINPSQMAPNLLLLLYNEEEFKIGRSLNDLTILCKEEIIAPPYSGWNLGLIDSIIPGK